MPWVLAFHIIAVISWFAGLFYLPRLFVYHADTQDGVSNERFKVMERRLYKGIMFPSAILSIALGLWLISFNYQYYLHQGWLHAKLTLVMFLIGYHFICGKYVRAFAADNNQHSSRYYRFFNEVPTVLLIAIVILAVVKPF